VDALLARLPDAPATTREAALIRVANELEDYLDLATHYYGRPGERGENFRITYMNECEGPLKEVAVALGFPQLAEEIGLHFEAVRSSPPISPRLRSGHNHMWMLYPQSGAPGLTQRTTSLAKLAMRRVRKARQLGIRGTIERVREMRG
jgi:hypothetical protein